MGHAAWASSSRASTARALLAAVVVAATVVPVVTAGAARRVPPVRFGDGHGLHVLDVHRYDQRDYGVRVLSPDLGRPIHIRLLLPAGYARQPHRRYPVLYLFHGTSGYASDWIEAGDAVRTTAPYPVITVMPEVGFDGDGGFWFTNWVDRTTTHGPSQFEHYLVHSLIPWVDQNLRTVAARRGRAVAGLSQGGYGSAEMAARHPDLFVSMASFSGAPEIERDPEVFAGAIAVIEAIEVGLDHVPPFSELGSPVLDRVNWAGHDPATLIENLRGMRIDLWTGMGADGPYDAQPDPAGSGIEALVYESTQHFYGHLVAEGIPAYYDNYVYGTHSFPYWARDLRQYMPRLMHDFAQPTAPRTISYTSIEPRWSQWGYTVTLHRSQRLQFSTLSDGRRGGFRLAGSGSADVVTPAWYRPGACLVARLSGTTTGARILRVDRHGRVRLRFALGDGGAVRVALRQAH